MDSEQVWNFHVGQGFEFEKNGAAFFSDRAIKMAETIGYRVVSITNVELKTGAGGKWFVTGKVGLKPSYHV